MCIRDRCEAAREDLKLAEQRCERLEASNGRRDEAQQRALEGLEASLKASRDAERARDAAEAEQAKELAVAAAVAERDARAQAEAQSLRGEVARLRDEVLAAEEARGVSMDEKTAEARAALARAEERAADERAELAKSLKDDHERALAACKAERDAAVSLSLIDI